MRVSASSISFKYQKGTPAPVPAVQPVTVTAQAGGPVPFRVTVSEPWIVAAPEKGTTPGSLSVSVNPTGLSSGQYTGVVSIFNPPQAPNSISVTLTVSSAPAKLLTDSGTSLDMEGRADDPEPPVRTMRIFTDSGHAAFTLKSSAAWLKMSPDTATAAAFSPATITLTADTSALIVGQKITATVTATTSDTPASVVTATVNVTLNPGVARVSSVWPEKLNVTTQDATLTVRGAEFHQASTTLTINKTSAKLTVLSPTIATATVPAALLAKPGTIEIGIRNLTKDATVVQRISVVAPIPVIDTVLNAASYELAANGGAPLVCPGELISIFGSDLGPERALIASPDKKGEYALNLGTTKVQIKAGGGWVPIVPLLSYKSQINALLPFGFSGPTLQLQVENDGMKSEPMDVDVREAAPGVFTADGTGMGQAAVLNYDRDGRAAGVNSAQKPAMIDGYLAIFATGCGDLKSPLPFRNVVDAGKVPPEIRAPVSIIFDDLIDVPAQWAGPVPGMAPGLCQINVKVPAVSNPRKGVPVQVRVGDAVTRGATVVSIAN